VSAPENDRFSSARGRPRKTKPAVLDAFAVAAVPARYAIERRRWDEAAALSLPQQGTFVWNDFPHAEAALVFARALGAARGGDTDAAKKDLNRLQELRANLIKANSEGTWQQYWVSKIENDRQVVTAWIAYKHGQRNEALHLLRAAADHQDSTEWDPVMPGHIISARQNLGEMLLDANDPTEALQAFEAALKTEPFRFWSLYGAGRAAGLSGDGAKAEAYYAMLVGQTASADVQQYPDLKVARAFLEKE
jgi:tetratricopeptide (TPR) repeat protein